VTQQAYACTDRTIGKLLKRDGLWVRPMVTVHSIAYVIVRFEQ
jgi:hypothetical protein